MNQQNKTTKTEPIYFVNKVMGENGKPLFEPITIDYNHPRHATSEYGSHAFGPMNVYSVPPFRIMETVRGIPYNYTDPTLLKFERSDMGNCQRFMLYNGYIKT